MNDFNEAKLLNYKLDDEGIFVLEKLAKWNKIIGIIFIVMGVISLLGIFAEGSNIALVLFTIVISVLMVYLGTRLTGAANHIRQSINSENAEIFKYGLDNLRQYFMLTGLFYFVGFIFMLLIMVFGAFFGIGAESLYDI